MCKLKKGRPFCAVRPVPTKIISDMTPHIRIAALLDDPKHYFCTLGHAFEGRLGDGLQVIFWPTGQARSLTRFRNGVRDGVRLCYRVNGMLSSVSYFRNDLPYGEAMIVSSSGYVIKHVLRDGTEEVRAADSDRRRFAGFLVNDTDLKLVSKYEILGPQIRSAWWPG